MRQSNWIEGKGRRCRRSWTWGNRTWGWGKKSCHPVWCGSSLSTPLVVLLGNAKTSQTATKNRWKQQQGEIRTGTGNKRNLSAKIGRPQTEGTRNLVVLARTGGSCYTGHFGDWRRRSVSGFDSRSICRCAWAVRRCRYTLLLLVLVLLCCGVGFVRRWEVGQETGEESREGHWSFKAANWVGQVGAYWQVEQCRMLWYGVDGKRWPGEGKRALWYLFWGARTFLYPNFSLVCSRDESTVPTCRSWFLPVRRPPGRRWWSCFDRMVSWSWRFADCVGGMPAVAVHSTREGPQHRIGASAETELLEPSSLGTRTQCEIGEVLFHPW